MMTGLDMLEDGRLINEAIVRYINLFYSRVSVLDKWNVIAGRYIGSQTYKTVCN